MTEINYLDIITKTLVVCHLENHTPLGSTNNAKMVDVVYSEILESADNKNNPKFSVYIFFYFFRLGDRYFLSNKKRVALQAFQYFKITYYFAKFIE